MVGRAPTVNGIPLAIENKAEVLALDGVRNVALIDTGVAVRADTFGQAIDGVRALKVRWRDGPVAGDSDEDVLMGLRKAELPLPTLPGKGLARPVGGDLTFWFRRTPAMAHNSASADLRAAKSGNCTALKTT